MIRFLFRLTAMASLAVAVIMAVLDATRTIAASTLVMTPLADSWQAASPGTLAAARDWAAGSLHPAAWEWVFAPVLTLPGAVVFGAAAFLLFVLGRRRAGRLDGFAVEG